MTGEQFTGWSDGVMSREEVAQAAYQAGWRNEDLVKIVAIAYRESSGHYAVFVDRPSTGDWSYGLVGLNMGKPDASSGEGPMWQRFYSKLDYLHSPDDLRDPVKNMMAAKALFDSSGWRPWGPYKGQPETYGTNVDAARSAVEAAASHGLLGSETPDHFRELHPDDAAGVHPAVETFVKAALAQDGDRYVFGATPNPNDPDPTKFDCSSLVQWAAHRAGVDLQRTAAQQFLQLKGMNSTISVDEALHTPGALLFHFDHDPAPGEVRRDGNHVAISLGDGRAIEAVGSKWGVRTVNIESFHHGGDHFFTHAAVVPGLTDTTAAAPPPLPADVVHPTPQADPALDPGVGVWRGDGGATPPSIPGHVLEPLAFVPPAGVDSHSEDHVLQPLASDPHQQPPVTSGPAGHPLENAADARSVLTPVDALHPDASHPVVDVHDPGHDSTDHPLLTPSSWAHGTELPGEIHLHADDVHHDDPTADHHVDHVDHGDHHGDGHV